jgi:sarcosine oxidase
MTLRDPATYDLLVVGLGAVGSAAAYHAAWHGHRVLGLDRFHPPHTQGASHGGSRIIRKAYFEGEHYLPLLHRAYGLWRDLEVETGQDLLRITGGLHLGRPASGVVHGARHSAETHGLDHEVLEVDGVARRFPVFQLPDGHIAVYEADAGILTPERCIQAHLDAARAHGADLHTGEVVTRWSPDGAGVQVRTDRATYRAGRLLLCAGGWINDLLPNHPLPLRIERQVQGWFAPGAPSASWQPDACPIYVWEDDAGQVLYGFPDRGDGVKAGLHHGGTEVEHPADLQRDVTEADIDQLKAALQRLFPGLGAFRRASTCFYTNTPDKHYLLDQHPEAPQVVLASACSGHGFKASNAIGAAMVERAIDDATTLDLRAFGRDRLKNG